MNSAAKIEGTPQAWEDGTLGEHEEHAVVAETNEAEIDAAAGLQPISIRLHRTLLDNLKALAQLNGIGYQPLIRQVLTRWVDGELKQILAASANAQAASRALEAARAEEQSRKAA